MWVWLAGIPLNDKYLVLPPGQRQYNTILIEFGPKVKLLIKH